MSKKILIIEDEEDIRISLQEILQLQGYEVLAAENGLEALKLLSANSQKSQLPDLILLDMKMPVMDGWEFAKKFNDSYSNACPIIITTAAADSEQRAKDINAAGWVSKPFEVETLLKKIKEF